MLAFVSKPTFDPNLFVDGIDADSWRELNESIDKPLLNRALRGTYPPGSTYKPFMAMAALNTGKRSPSDAHQRPRLLHVRRPPLPQPRRHGRGGSMDMRRAIVKSSNVYFYSLANEMGVDLIHDQLEPFGFGRRTGIDLDGEVTGVLPSTDWKRKKLTSGPSSSSWYAGETISLGIGQGYNNFTMLQLATATATLVSGGQRFKPRLVREIEDVITRPAQARGQRRAASRCRSSPSTCEVIRSALHGVTQEGTSRVAFAGAAYASGGKTGTAQAVGARANEKYNAAKLEEHKRDHALYIAAAPIDAPTVALAVIVENAGFGLAVGRADRAPRLRLPAARPVPERGGPGRDARRQGGRADRHAAARGRRARCRDSRRRRPRPRRRHSPRRHAARGAAGRGSAGPAPMSAVFEQAVALAAPEAHLRRLRRPAAAGHRAAGRGRAW